MPIRPEGYTKTKSPCKYCPIKKDCWSKTADIGSIEISPMGVKA